MRVDDRSSMFHGKLPVFAVLRSLDGTNPDVCIRAAKEIDRQGFIIEITTTAYNHPVIANKLTSDGVQNGIGTIKDADLARSVLGKVNRVPFLVGPNLSPGVILLANANRSDVVPGVLTEEEIWHARNLGARKFNKVFPSAADDSQEFYDAIIHPFRPEITELLRRGWKVVVYDSKEYGDLKLNLTTDQIIVTTPTEFYNFYKAIIESELEPLCPIVIKLPGGKIGIERLKELAGLSSELGIKTIASGIENAELDDNLRNILGKAIAPFVALGGIFSPQELKEENIKPIVERGERIASIVEKI